MVIEFSSPVADVQFEVYGARTVTDNRGNVVHLNPPLFANGRPLGAVLVYLGGAGINRITVSDPIVTDVGAPGAWEMWVANGRFSLESTYQQCNCNRPTFARPSQQAVSSPDWSGNQVNDWRMDVEISDDDGLVLKNVRLENRYMAEKISVPYYLLDTASTTVPLRGELTPAGTDFFMRSRLVSYETHSDSEKLVVEAIYAVDQIPAGSTNCLQIVQHYEFYKAGAGCEPSETLPCARWKPSVSYRFLGPPNEFESLNIVQRYHFMDNGFQQNSVGLFRDCDGFPCVMRGEGWRLLFREKLNPLGNEYSSNIIRQGQDGNKWDNFHQTFALDVQEPAEFPHLLSPGCPECVHFHWRWGAHLGPKFGEGKPLIKSGSNQDVDMAVARARVSEEDPVDYLDLVREPESIRNLFGYSGYSFYGGEDVVFWYSSTGYQFQDTFFPIPGGFFNPSYEGISAPIDEAPTNPLAPATKKGRRGPSPSQPSPLDASQDHPETVVFGDQYEDGSTSYTAIDPATVGSIPNKYAVYSNDAYDIATEATVSGPHVVTFNIASVTDPTVFSKLRILHVEPDSFDPAKPQLIDRTILSPDTPAPDFNNRRISARADGLGIFVLTTLVEPPPPPNGVADLAVTVSDAPDSATAGSNLTYTVTVTNNGPQAATDLMLNDTLAPEANFVSVTSSQGTCREFEGRILCNLDSLAASGNAVVTINVTPTDGGTPFPPAGKSISNLAAVKATEDDSNLLNNSSSQATLILPDPNLAPSITIDNPASDTTLVGPVNISLSATATDDGTIAGVDFFENETLIGSATTTGNNQYTLEWTNITFGIHTVVAIATDNLGKTAVSKPVVVNVNGTAAVSIVSPADWSVFALPAAFTINASATVAGGTINRVEFYSDGDLLGIGTFTAPNNYAFTVSELSSGQHTLRAVAIDNSGVATTSSAVRVVVNNRPAISLISPAQGTVYLTAPASITLTANATDWDGGILKVEFYRNGTFLATNTSFGVNQYNFTWPSVPVGTYSLTAVATDSLGATTTSAPITVRVNAAPSVSITSPATGAQFAAPANITLVATATDNDGTISNVDFRANGSSIGTATPIGGNQFSLNWSNVPFGSYVISAVARDNDNATTTANGPTVTVTSPVLFVTGSTTLNPSDAAVKTRLEALGHTVVVKDGASATTADATGKALVLISSTVTPTSVGTKFRTVTVPVIVWESGLLNNMGMTGSTNKDFGTKTNQTQVTITTPGHPLAGGFTGTVTVVPSAKTFDWGKPNANAISIATLAGDAAKTGIFAYEPGVAMPGLTAPARRLALFLFDDTAASFNSSGIALLDAAIRWARGGGSLSGSVVTSPIGNVNLTTEGSIDWAHWGRNGPTVFDHKTGVTQKIPNVTKIGAGALNWFNDCPTNFSWSDGTPALNVSNTPTGINTNGSVGNGFEITVPADTNLRTLKVYIGVWFTQGKLEATLSDGSAPAYIDTSQNKNNGSSNGLYTINFKAASTGQSLKVRFTILTQYFSPNGVVSWEAATLQ